MNTRWPSQLLDDVCEVEYGTRVVQRRDGGQGYPVYGGGGATFAIDRFNREDRVVVARFGMSEQCTRFVAGKFFLNDSGLTLRPKDPKTLLPAFLDKWTFGATEQIFALGKGTAQKNLDLPAFRVLRIPVPPVAEQLRIVAELDQAAVAIAKATGNTDRNLANARELFASHLQKVFASHDAGWIQRSLGDLARINYGYTESASSESVGPHFLRITDIQDNRVDWTTVPYCPIDVNVLHKYLLVDGDIVFARTGATTGKSYLVTNPPEAVFASYLIRVQLKNNDVSPQFVNLYFQTHSYWDTIRAGTSGSAQGGFNASKLGALVIPFPRSLRDQKAIVERLEALAADTLQLESVYRRKLESLRALTATLLSKAIQNPL